MTKIEEKVCFHFRFLSNINEPLLLIYIDRDWLGIHTQLYYAEHVHIVQTRTGIPIPYFCIAQQSKSVPESVSGNVNEPLERAISYNKKISLHQNHSSFFETPEVGIIGIFV